MSPFAVSQPPFAVCFGSSPAIHLAGLSVLGGCPVDNPFPSARPAGVSGPWRLFHDGPWLLGIASETVPFGALETLAGNLYESLLGLLGKKHLCRIWNYVPAINDDNAQGIENYRAFCRARSHAFARHFGARFKQEVPSACAVGSDGDQLTIIFAAHDSLPLHLENPLQIPAYEYPSQHGPTPPSFARATVLQHPSGLRDVFIAGTSAIRGHETLFPGHTARQLDVTLENLHAIGRAAGLPAETASHRIVKVYLRHEGDFPEVKASLEARFTHPRDKVSYLLSDICRADLNVEIDVTALGVRPASS